MKRALFLLLSALAVIPVHAGYWKLDHYTANMFPVFNYFDNDGTLIGRWLTVGSSPQPNNYTCGATNVSNGIYFLTGISYDILSVYNYINSDRASGITTDEMKQGLVSVSSYTEKVYGKYASISLNEKGFDDLDTAVRNIISRIFSTNRPVIIYGNSVSGLPGGHYHMVKASVYRKSSNLIGVWINDPMYGSPSYPGQGIGPNVFLPLGELATYWRKTGAPFYRLWDRKHTYLEF